MKTKSATVRVGKRFEVVIPKAIREELGLAPKMRVRFVQKKGDHTIRLQRDTSGMEEAFKKWAGTGRRSLLDDGFKSVDEYMAFIRGRG